MKTAGSAGCRSTAAARTVSDRAGVSWLDGLVFSLARWTALHRFPSQFCIKIQ